RAAVRQAVEALIDALEAGTVRAATPPPDRDDASAAWTVHPWVKRGILLGFRFSDVVDLPPAGPLGFRDKQAYPPRPVEGMPGVRVVAGGTAVRRGAHVGPGAILMPPCYVNVGAFVAGGSMVDSHALVGSCAQIGGGVHLSAGAQIGGVLEPPGAMPVIVEDDCFVGALTAVVEGVRLGAGTVVGAGVVLTRSTPVYDLARRRLLRAGADGTLVIPPRSVLIPGTRPIGDAWGREQGLSAGCAILVKERDAGTDARAALEEVLR
ncbi:MAG: 2,3,4,5-tetrahydropyridine-2,6-dicarboxylate N-succinyltransferase, partial [Acidobacteria bacterium]|nr:2,3,4,5-tetrahydropyridine-2,6-dicarboxylate N-succinyltransferase [Acidobacteriota bacterium]